MKKIPKLHKRQILISLAALLILFLLSAQILVDFVVFRNDIQARPDGETTIIHLISAAVTNLNKPAPLDASSGRAYIPEARIVLPAFSQPIGQILYNYYSGDNASHVPAMLGLTSSSNVNLAINKLWIAQANDRTPWQDRSNLITGVFNQVPNLQACARGVQIFYSKQNFSDGYVFQGSRKLQDGRTLYIYTETGCHEDQGPIVNMAKQAQSY